MKRQELPKLPDGPGVYIFRGPLTPHPNPLPRGEGVLLRSSASSPRESAILYIGKATSLRDRVKSYFGKDLIKTRGMGLVDMVTRATTVTFEETLSVLEALVLESVLIKKHKPFYNTKEKDDKSHYFVAITDETHPIILLERGKNIDFKKLQTTNYKLRTVFGPFPHGPMIREGLRILRRIFPFDTPQSMKKNHSVFYRQIGLAPDVSNPQAHIRYLESIRHIALFLSGKSKELAKSLERDMKAAAKSGEFELAAQLRNQLFALRHIQDVALLKHDLAPLSLGERVGVRAEESFRLEAYDIAHISGSSMVGVMTVVTDGLPAQAGEPDKSSYRKFIIRSVSKSNDPAALREVLERRMKHSEWPMPNLIVVDGNEVQRSVAVGILESMKFDIPVVAVVKDERHKPRAILGDESIISKHKRAILLANSESHRFALSFHRDRRGKKLLGL